MGAAVGDGVVAPARVIGSVGSDRADLYISGDLVEKLGQHGRVTDVAAGDFDGSDLQRLFIDADVDLAPQTAFRTAMLAGLPLTFALRLDAGAVDQKVQRPLRAPVGNTHSQGFPAPARAVLKSGTAQSRPTSRRRLSTNPVVCLRAMPKMTFIVRHVWIAASLYCGCRPRLPVGGGTQTMSGSNQIVREPRCFSASL